MNIVLCAENKTVASAVLQTLVGIGCVPEIANSTYDLLEQTIHKDIIILETNDDAVRLTQVVYELYRKKRGECVPYIIALLSNLQVMRNQAVTLWNIDGCAALAALIISDRPHYEREVAAFITRIRSHG